MPSVVSTIKDTVSISQFNRGLAEKIFTDMKDNMAEVVLLSPDEYLSIMDTLNDYLVLTMAVERMSAFDSDNLISEEKIDRRFGITDEDLAQADEVEFE